MRRRFVLTNYSSIYADYQTAGRGRLTRTWHSEKGQNLLFSILIKDKKLIENFSALSLASAVCVINILEKLEIKNLSFKWPNDVYADGKKICGILLQSVSQNEEVDALIIGIGLNVNQTQFDGEFLTPPTSIKLEVNKEFKIRKIRNLLLSEIKKEFTKIKIGESNYLQKVNELNNLKGKEVLAEIDGEKKTVKVLLINPDNTLKVLCENKELNLNSGEITFHI